MKKQGRSCTDQDLPQEPKKLTGCPEGFICCILRMSNRKKIFLTKQTRGNAPFFRQKIQNALPKKIQKIQKGYSIFFQKNREGFWDFFIGKNRRCVNVSLTYVNGVLTYLHSRQVAQNSHIQHINRAKFVYFICLWVSIQAVFFRVLFGLKISPL